MSVSEPSGDELDPDTITDNKLANWLNKYGPDWVLEVERLDGETEYLGYVDGRFRNYNERGINFIALDYLGEIADRVRSVDYVAVEESPLHVDDEEDADEDEDQADDES
jgi:hypothetical protein